MGEGTGLPKPHHPRRGGSHLAGVSQPFEAPALIQQGAPVQLPLPCQCQDALGTALYHQLGVPLSSPAALWAQHLPRAEPPNN